MFAPPGQTDQTIHSDVSFPASGMVGDRLADAPGASAPGVAAGLPCLNSHNSIEATRESARKLLTGSHRRMAFCLIREIEKLAAEYGLEHLGLLTLTFGDRVLSMKEANRRFDSLNSNVLKGRYKRVIVVPERHKSQVVHFHLVVVLDADIRTGIDFDGIRRRDYRSASRALRAEWAFLRRIAPRYGFGRTELLPIKSTAEGIAKYVGKYIAKHVCQRLQEDKGARTVRFIGYQPGGRGTASHRCFRPSFSWNSPHGWLWRRKLAQLAKEQGMTSMEDMARKYGPRWCFGVAGSVLSTDLPEGTVFPTLQLAEEESLERFVRWSRREAREDAMGPERIMARRFDCVDRRCSYRGEYSTLKRRFSARWASMQEAFHRIQRDAADRNSVDSSRTSDSIDNSSLYGLVNNNTS